MGIKFTKHDSHDDSIIDQRKPIRRYPLLRWLMIVFVVSLPFLYLLYQFSHEYLLMRYPGFVSYNQITIRSPINGYITKLNVRLSQAVNTGEVIAQFSSPEIDMKLNYLYKEKKLVKESMILFRKNDEHALADELEEAKEDIAQTQLVYKQFLDHKSQGTIVSLQLEQARLNWSNAKKLYYSLKNQIYRMKRDRTHMSEVFYRRKIAEIDRDIKLNQTLAKNLIIRAKSPLRVIAIDTYQSEYVTEGRKIITLSTNKNLHVVGFIPPKYSDKVKKGLSVKVYFPDKTVVNGVISKDPSFARRLPVNYVNPIAERANHIVIIVRLDAPASSKKYIYGVPVRIGLR